MKQSKIIIIQDYLKKYQPSLININKVKKNKNNFIVNCTIYYKSTIQVPISDVNNYNLNETNILHNITEQKTYIIPQKDIQFPTKRKLPVINKIHLVNNIP